MKQLSAVTTFAILMCFAVTASLAQDNAASREAAADRYLKVVPMSKMLDDTFTEISKQVPEDQRVQFLAQMKAIVRVDVLDRIARESMVKTFTTDELNALANFYGSQHGASAMEKFGVYMGQVMPAIQQEIQSAIQQMDAQQKN
jgi:hypothetical protein